MLINENVTSSHNNSFANLSKQIYFMFLLLILCCIVAIYYCISCVSSRMSLKVATNKCTTVFIILVIDTSNRSLIGSTVVFDKPALEWMT